MRREPGCRVSSRTKDLDLRAFDPSSFLILNYKGWDSQVRRGFPRISESVFPWSRSIGLRIDRIAASRGGLAPWPPASTAAARLRTSLRWRSGGWTPRPIRQLRIWISGGFDSRLILSCKGWNSQVHRESPRSLESTILSLRIVSLRIDRNSWDPRLRFARAARSHLRKRNRLQVCLALP